MATSSKAQGKKPMQLRDEDSDYEKEDEPVQQTKAAEKKKASRKQKDSGLTPEEYYELFKKQKFEGTRYPCVETMRELGIEGDVEYLFQECHLGPLMHTPRASYQEETLQFLSTLELHILPRGFSVITFKVFDQNYSLLMSNVETHFGFPSGNGTKPEYNKNELDLLWELISSERVFNSSRSKSSQIRSPVLRYFQKSLANVLFARSNAGTIVNGEMELLDMALKDLLEHAKDESDMQGDSTNTSLSYVLVNQLLSYKQWVKTIHTRGHTGVICVGGIVTVILNACQVPLQSSPVDHHWIDVEYLQHAQTLMKARVNGKLAYSFIRPTSEHAQILLPCEHQTSFSEPGSTGNIEFNPPEEFLHKTRARTTSTSAGVQDAGITDAPMETEEYQPEYRGEGYAPEQYYFDEYRGTTRQGKAVSAAHDRANSLQQWNKAQDMLLKAQGKELRAAKKEIKSLKSRFTTWIKKMSCSYSAATLNTASTSPVHQAAYGTEEQADSEQEEQADYMQEDQPEQEQPEYETEVQIPFAPARHSSYQHREQEYAPVPARSSAHEPRERPRRSVKRKHRRQGSKRRQEGGPSAAHPLRNF